MARRLKRLSRGRKWPRQRVGMYSSFIIYYAKPGLESQVFQSYMVSSGYKVQVVDDRIGESSALDADPSAIVVIAEDQGSQELLAHVESLRARVEPGHIFVISSAESTDPELSGIQVIPRPYRLSELVRRIRALSSNTVNKR